MTDLAQKRVQEAMEPLMHEIDTTHLRKMQATMHMCAYKCCQDEKTSSTQMQRCIEQCQGSIEKASNAVEEEMKQFSDRLMRCSQTCADKLRDKYGKEEPKGEQLAEAHKMLDKCMLDCADHHIGLIPAMKKRIDSTLRKLQ